MYHEYHSVSSMFKYVSFLDHLVNNQGCLPVLALQKSNLGAAPLFIHELL